MSSNNSLAAQDPDEELLIKRLGASASLHEVVRLIRAVAPGDVGVLISGESGVGKEVTARLIHELSGRKHGPFIAVDCAAIAPNLIQSELFGYEKGAFTGATSRKRGKFELAHGGTLFLDEIGNMPLAVQATLLRFIEAQQFERVGGTDSVQISVRIIGATNTDLKLACTQNRFREDLFHRLSKFTLHIPPLRERREDILPFSHRILSELAEELGREPPQLSKEAVLYLQGGNYPGNFRELKNILHRAFILADTVIEPSHLMSEPLNEGQTLKKIELDYPVGVSLKKVYENILPQIERDCIRDALVQSKGHQTRAARLLGITHRTLYSKMKALGLSSKNKPRKT